MDNQKKLQQAFEAGLQLSPESYHEGLEYNTIPEWDSTGHMTLIVEIEKQFNVMLTMDDIIDMSSVSEARRILAKQGVVF